MYEIDFNTPIHVHFIGIGGISMSGLAQVLLSKGFTVSGSDNLKSALTEELSKAGAEIYIGQRASNISENIDLVVYTAAIHEDNPEFARCVELSLPMMSRACLLGQMMKNYDVVGNLKRALNRSGCIDEIFLLAVNYCHFACTVYVNKTVLSLGSIIGHIHKIIFADNNVCLVKNILYLC